MLAQIILRSALFILASLFINSSTVAQESEELPEAPSITNATYVEPSATRVLKHEEKIGQLFKKNNTQEYVLQRLTQRTYWVQRHFYATIFYVGNEGVLLFDPLDSRGAQIQKAIATVTDLPVTAIVYSHNHADHIGDAQVFTETVGGLRIIASEKTAKKLANLNSSHPTPTEVVAWPRGSFTFEGLAVDFHGFERAAHVDDHGIWQLTAEKIVHLPDLVNPDQPPFWAFAGSENFIYYEDNLNQLEKLDWTFLSGGHGNIGAKADVEFYRQFLGDLKQAVGKAMQETAWGTGVDNAKLNAHTPLLPAWLSAISKQATDALRSKYGAYYGFEAATPRNAEMVAISMFSYR